MILVVDDDALICLNMADQLVELGYKALEAYSGREALALLDQHPEIRLIVTDYSMPLMTGVELIEAALAKRPDLLVLLTTGYAELPEGIACTLPRLEKPFSEEQLAKKIAELFAETANPAQ
jgi:CheY-like chemotaxis protein